jgi:DNA-binding IclR family transcriptional regulator
MVIAGVQNISVPVFDYSGKVIAALTIPFIQRLIKNNDPDLGTAANAMLLAGEKVSNFLGANAALSV